jgi:hypothetical protein
VLMSANLTTGTSGTEAQPPSHMMEVIVCWSGVMENWLVA